VNEHDDDKWVIISGGSWGGSTGGGGRKPKPKPHLKSSPKPNPHPKSKHSISSSNSNSGCGGGGKWSAGGGWGGVMASPTSMSALLQDATATATLSDALNNNSRKITDMVIMLTLLLPPDYPTYTSAISSNLNNNEQQHSIFVRGHACVLSVTHTPTGTIINGMMVHQSLPLPLPPPINVSLAMEPINALTTQQTTRGDPPMMDITQTRIDDIWILILIIFFLCPLRDMITIQKRNCSPGVAIGAPSKRLANQRAVPSGNCCFCGNYADHPRTPHQTIVTMAASKWKSNVVSGSDHSISHWTDVVCDSDKYFA
jgi:hypothetical protein